MLDIDPLRPPHPFTPQHLGVLIDLDDTAGRGGECVAGLVILLARKLGYQPDTPDLDNLAYGATTATAHLWPDERADRLFDAADDAADWLTEHHAPPGHCFDFTDEGAFLLRLARPAEVVSAPAAALATTATEATAATAVAAAHAPEGTDDQETTQP